MVFKVLHVIVPEFDQFSISEPAAVEDRRMIGTIANHHIVFADEHGDNALVRGKTCCKHQAVFFFHEFRQTRFQFDVQIDGPVKKAGTRAAGPVFFNRFNRGFLYIRV